jgi:UDP-N-acetyl-D-glucosamine/UDP-N-acetyl-D-galactosamine dehydrogenase
MAQRDRPIAFEQLVEEGKPVCVVGLGYVGLPLAMALNKKFPVVGFDVNERRVQELIEARDSTHEVGASALRASTIEFTSKPEAISNCPFVIVAVPTPVDDSNMPDLTAIRSATETVARQLSQGSVVVYESTVYPGVTEEVCVPILESVRGWCWKKDFFVGYSPERVNPGDKEHTIDRIVKVVSGDVPETLELVASVYGAAIPAGVYRTTDIKTAEAAKVIENTQRDLNIALVNELAIIFNRMGLDTRQVLEAAATKWNFLRFEPGLVGGHCIGVDPYYLTYRAQSLGYHPEVILAGRRINDSMGKYVAEMTVKKLLSTGNLRPHGRILILGLSFKEDIGDIRNSKVVDIDEELRQYGLEPCIYDPHADKREALAEYGVELVDRPEDRAPYDAVVIAVKHQAFRELLTVEWYRRHGREAGPVVIDVKGLHAVSEISRAGIPYWRL